MRFTFYSPDVGVRREMTLKHGKGESKNVKTDTHGMGRTDKVDILWRIL